MPHFSDDLHLDTCAGRYCGRMMARSAMHRIAGKRGWFCGDCFTKRTSHGGSGRISPPSRDTLIRCSGDGCANLIYLDEAVKGHQIHPNLQGRFCLDCAKRRGYWTPADVSKLHDLLQANGFFARSPLDLIPKKVPRPRKIKPEQEGMF